MIFNSISSVIEIKDGLGATITVGCTLILVIYIVMYYFDQKRLAMQVEQLSTSEAGKLLETKGILRQEEGGVIVEIRHSGVPYLILVLFTASLTALSWPIGNSTLAIILLVTSVCAVAIHQHRIGVHLRRLSDGYSVSGFKRLFHCTYQESFIRGQNVQFVVGETSVHGGDNVCIWRLEASVNNQHSVAIIPEGSFPGFWQPSINQYFLKMLSAYLVYWCEHN